MAKRQSGFATQKSAAFPVKSANYTADELSALSKIDGSNPYGLDPNHVKLCELCGRPLSADSPFQKPTENYSFLDQYRRGRHISCDAYRSQIATEKQIREQAQAQAKYDAMSDEDKKALDDKEAAQWNDQDQYDPRQINVAGQLPKGTRVTPYRPKPGELSLDKVTKAGGVSKALAPDLPDKFEFAKEEDPKIIAQTAEREADIRRQFAIDMARVEADKK